MAYVASSTSPMSRLRVSIDSEHLAKLLLRVALGVLILLHGIGKLNGGIDSVLGAVTAAGFPAAFGHLVYVGEVLAPLLLVVGAWTRAAAIVVAINMVVAVLLVHVGQLASLSSTGGWSVELQACYLVMALAVALLGAGRFSAGGADGRWN